jgi:hypothetical protein
MKMFMATFAAVVSLNFILINCSDSTTPPTANVIVVDNPGDGGQGNGDQPTKSYFIKDRTGKEWDVTHAKEKYNMEPSQYEFGLGPFAIRPIQNPKMLSPGQSGYPDKSLTFLILGAKLGEAQADVRAYPISVMSRHEIANEVIADQPVAVAY